MIPLEQGRNDTLGTRAHLYTSSVQAPYPSLPGKPESSLITLHLLFASNPLRRECGAHGVMFCAIAWSFGVCDASGALPLRQPCCLPLVLASSIFFAPPQAAGLIHFAARPLRVKPASLGFAASARKTGGEINRNLPLQHFHRVAGQGRVGGGESGLPKRHENHKPMGRSDPRLYAKRRRRSFGDFASDERAVFIF